MKRFRIGDWLLIDAALLIIVTAIVVTLWRVMQ